MEFPENRYNIPFMHARIHFINFFRKLTVTSLLFLMPLHFLKIGLSGLQIGAIISLWAAPAGNLLYIEGSGPFRILFSYR